MATKEKIAIVGAGGFGREVYHLLADFIDGVSYDCIGFIDCKDNPDLPVSVIGHENDMPQIMEDYHVSNCVLALGVIQKRKDVFLKLEKYSLSFPKIIESSGK